MITMITGIPGMGKTSLLIQMLLKELNKGFDARPLFIMGIPELKIDYSKVPPVNEWTEKRPDPDDPSLMLDYYTFPPNSILVVDECQRTFPARSSTSKPPPHVAALSTHRHTGIDIIVLTQKPNLVDSWLREMTQRHIHIKPTIMGRYLYEWPEFNDVNSKQNQSDAAKRKFSPPKEVFNLYKSAELHTKQPKRLHQVWLLLGFLIVMIGYFGYNLYNGLYKRVTGQSEAKVVQQKPADKKTTEATQNSPKPPQNQSVQQATNQQSIEELPHPYRGFDFNIKAVITSKRFNKTYYELTNGTKTVFTDSDQLIKLGYSINQPNDCSAFLFFNGAQVVATCNSQANSDTRQGGEFSLTTNPSKPLSTEPHYTPRPLIDASNYPASPSI